MKRGAGGEPSQPTERTPLTSTSDQSPSRAPLQIPRSGKLSTQNAQHEVDSAVASTPTLYGSTSMSRATCAPPTLRLDSNIITSTGDTTITANTINHYYEAPVGLSDPMKPLIDRVVWAAMHDADERYDPPRCHPETRTAVLSRIDQWATGRLERPVLWLNGPVGAGKSAIAQTLAERWKANGILGATFFMQRNGPGRNSREHILPTIVHQLCMHDTQVRAHVKNAMVSDPQILERSLGVQLDTLVAEAFVNADPPCPEDSVIRVIIVDGLDECCIPYKSQSHEEQQKQILDAIASVSRRGLSLRFLIASRPEPQIRNSFSYGPLADLCEIVSLTPAQGDVELYLRCKFAEIRAIHPAVDHAWPPEFDIRKLIINSSGHFVYPATVIRHLSSPRINPEASLRMILNQTVHPHDGQDWPLAQLDALYLHILHTAVHSIHANAFSTLQLFSLRGVEVPRSHTIADLAKYLHIDCSQLYADIVDLHSLLDVPCNPDDYLEFHHASFGEFLDDSRRSALFCVRHPLSLQLQLKLLKYAQQTFATEYHQDSGEDISQFMLVVSGDYSYDPLHPVNLNSVSNIAKFLVSATLMTNPNEIIRDLSFQRVWYITQRNAQMMLALFTGWIRVCYSPVVSGTGIDRRDRRDFFAELFVGFIYTIFLQIRIVCFFYASSLLLQCLLPLAVHVKNAAPGPAFYAEILTQYLSRFTFFILMKYIGLFDVLVMIIISIRFWYRVFKEPSSYII